MLKSEKYIRPLRFHLQQVLLYYLVSKLTIERIFDLLQQNKKSDNYINRWLHGYLNFAARTTFFSKNTGLIFNQANI